MFGRGGRILEVGLRSRITVLLPDLFDTLQLMTLRRNAFLSRTENLKEDLISVHREQFSKDSLSFIIYADGNSSDALSISFRSWIPSLQNTMAGEATENPVEPVPDRGVERAERA